jgi:hypothetical protein
MNFTWNTAELPQSASAHRGIRILAFSQYFGSATNTNRANHNDMVPKREGSDEAPMLAYELVRQRLELPHSPTERSAQIPTTSLDSLTEHAFCSAIYTLLVSRDGMVTVLPNLVIVVRRSPVIPVKKLGTRVGIFNSIRVLVLIVIPRLIILAVNNKRVYF